MPHDGGEQCLARREFGFAANTVEQRVGQKMGIREKSIFDAMLQNAECGGLVT